jgi:molybdopterin-guanine dinucleotide biosynthesis protein MobB
MTKVIAIIGRSGSGKTVTIVNLISHFSKQGLKVGTIKHVHHPNFSIDMEGKDSWRHSHAGAKTVAIIAPKETVLIRRKNRTTINLQLENILDLFKGEEIDLIFLEGFHSLIAKNYDIPKIITAKNITELRRVVKNTVPPILAVTGLVSKKKLKLTNIDFPIIDTSKESTKLIRLIEPWL